MEENPLIGVLQRLMNMSMKHGTAYAKVVWDADNDTFNFNIIPPQFVTVSYEKKNED